MVYTKYTYKNKQHLYTLSSDAVRGDAEYEEIVSKSEKYLRSFKDVTLMAFNESNDYFFFFGSEDDEILFLMQNEISSVVESNYWYDVFDI